jgi:nitroreductase
MPMNDATMIKIATVTAASRTPAEAIQSRRSIRAYLADPVSSDQVRQVLQLASHAPSGSNLQPWKVHVLLGETLSRVGAALNATFIADEAGHERDYKYYTDPLFEPYIARRRACGLGLYSTLGILRDQKDRMKAQRAMNYNFFGAPVGLVFTIDRRLEKGSWLDYGMFMQTIMIAARSFGLHTCPQASIGEFPDIVRKELKLSDDQIVVAGLSMGFADPDAIVNSFSPAREPVSGFATFYE